MKTIIESRMTADIEGDFVVFLIGMRVNKLWKIWKWIPVSIAMPKMLIELGRSPELGLLHARTHFGLRNTMVVQYWESVEKLQAYAQSKTGAHLPAWRAFNKSVGSNGDVGIWHETYIVKGGQFETVYNNMPAYGLGAASNLVPATGKRSSAADRLKGSS